MSLFASCKPPEDSGSDVKAIVGTEGGKNKAMAFVSVRNAVQSKVTIPETYNGKAALSKIYETFYALVECEDRGKSKADTWMNYLEFYGLSSVLYVDGKRRIHINKKQDGEIEKVYFNACSVIGKVMLNLPMLLSSAAMVDEFPGNEPTNAFYRDQYLLVQSIYLAMRGPWRSAGYANSPFMVGMVANSKNYPEVSFSERDLGAGFKGADTFYNPCDKKKRKVRFGYMQNWKNDSYTCVPSTIDSKLFNYKPGGNTSYTDVKNRLKTGLATLYASTQGGITGSSKPIDKLTAALMTTENWQEVGPLAKPYAQFLMGKGSFKPLFNSSLGLTTEGELQGVGFSLSGKSASTSSVSKGRRELIKKVEIQRKENANVLRGLDILSKNQFSPNFMRFNFEKDKDNLAYFGERQRQLNASERGKVYKELNGITESSNKALARKGLTNDAKERIILKRLMLRSKVLESAMNNDVYNNATAGTSVFKQQDYTKEFGVESVMSQDKNVYLTQGAKGALTEHNRLSAGDNASYKKTNTSIDKDATLWVDQSLRKRNGATKVSWQKKGVGGQIVETDGLKIQSDFLGNKRENGTRSNVGMFTLNDGQLKSATDQLNTLTSNATDVSKLNNANNYADKVKSGQTAEGVTTEALYDRGRGVPDRDTQNAINASPSRQSSGYWDQMKAGFGQMGTGLNVASTANKADYSIQTQLDQLNGSDTNTQAFNASAAKAQRELSTARTSGLSTAWKGTKNTASATSAMANDMYQNNKYVKGATDYVGSTGVATVAKSAWGAASSWYNGSGTKQAQSQPANSIPPPQATPSAGTAITQSQSSVDAGIGSVSTLSLRGADAEEDTENGE